MAAPKRAMQKARYPVKSCWASMVILLFPEKPVSGYLSETALGEGRTFGPLPQRFCAAGGHPTPGGNWNVMDAMFLLAYTCNPSCFSFACSANLNFNKSAFLLTIRTNSRCVPGLGFSGICIVIICCFTRSSAIHHVLNHSRSLGSPLVGIIGSRLCLVQAGTDHGDGERSPGWR